MTLLKKMFVSISATEIKIYLLAEWNCKCRKLYLVCLSFCLLSDLSQNGKIPVSLANFLRCVQTAEWMSPPVLFASGTFVEVSWNKQFVSLTFSDLNCDSEQGTHYCMYESFYKRNQWEETSLGTVVLRGPCGIAVQWCHEPDPNDTLCTYLVGRMNDLENK